MSATRRRRPSSLIAPHAVVAGLAIAASLAPRPSFALLPQAPPEKDAAPSEERATIAVDPRTNSLVIVGSAKEVERLSRLIRQAQEQLPVESSRVYSVRLGDAADAVRLRGLIVQTLRTMTVRGEVGALASRVSVVADEAGRSLVVAATPADFRVVGELVAAFARTPAGESLAVRTYPLQSTTADRAAAGLRELLQAQVAAAGPGPVAVRFGDGDAVSATFDPSRVRVIADAGGNSLVVLAPEAAVGFVEEYVASTDRLPPADRAGLRVFPLRHARAELVEPGLSRILAARARDQRRRDPSAPEPQLAVDPRNNALLATGSQPQLAELSELLDSIDVEGGGGLLAADAVEVVPVRFADASELAQSLVRFLAERAEASGAVAPEASVVPSRASNSLLVGGSAESIAAVRRLVERMDLPQTGDRDVEILRVRRGSASEIARLVSEQFARRVTGAPVAVSSDERTNSVIVNAPAAISAQVKALVASLDLPPASDETVLRTFRLETARADEAVRLLTQSLQLDAAGRAQGTTIRLEEGGEAVEVNARIVADRRSNSLIVTATPESVPVIETLVARIDEAPAASPTEFRVIALQHADAFDASLTLRQMLRAIEPGQVAPAIDYDAAENHLVIAASPDQFPRIEALVKQLDQPRSRPRTTDFIVLQFADAEKVREALSYFYGPFADQADRPSQRQVSIVADPATNSLVVSAEPSEWEGIRELVAKLDREDYDASLQLKVFALSHADARGVARAINEAFQGRLDREARAARSQAPEGEAPPPTTLVPAEDWVSVAAEEKTNSLVVSASRANLLRVERIIEELDTADFDRLPAPRVIPVERGDAEQLAAAITRSFGLEEDDPTRLVRVIGDRAASAIVVRAGEEDFAQIKALAESLQAQSAAKGLSVQLLALKNVPAARIAPTLREAFAIRARQANLPLSIGVDATANALVVTATGPLFEEIRATAEAMDSLAPASGQAIFLIDLEHVDPEVARSAVEAIGLDAPQPAGSIARLVGEPVKVALLPGRRSILVVASPADREIVIGFLKSIDVPPALPESRLRVIPLRLANAAATAALLNQLLDPAREGGGSSLAKAAREQIRRLSLRRNGVDEPDLALDLAVPVRILADDGFNALLVDSSPANVAAIETLAVMLDRLPVTDAVTVQILPLDNIAAEEFARIVQELFAEGARLAVVGGTSRRAMPEGSAGPALLEPVAVSVDERTNTVVVAGKEEAVALVEVLRQRLDGGVEMGWVEPRVITLRYADAEALAATLDAVLVSAREDLPESAALRRQVARLRVSAPGANRAVEGDIFRPMTELLIRPERQTNSLVAVGSPANLEILAGLVSLLDVEAAAPGATIRTYPIVVASAARIATLLNQLFEQQFQARLLKDEDRVRVLADERLNSIVVSTSPRSFALVEELLKSLDAPVAAELREIRMISLANAAATRVAPIVQQMMDARLDRLRRVQPETADLEKALVVADPRVNALVVAAGNDAFEVISRLAKDLDAAPPDEASLVEVVPLRGGDMARVAAAVERIMERRYADLPPEIARRSRPLVLTDPRTGSLLVAGSPEDARAIRGLIEQLEGMPMNAALGLAVVQIEKGRAEALAPRIQQLMQERTRSLGAAEGPADRVSVVADPASNTLLVAASEANVEVVRELVRLLGSVEGLDATLPVEVIMLTRGRASEMLQTVRSMYVDEANRSRGPNAVRVSADERLNALVVAAPEADVTAIRMLVARLDSASPGTVVEIKYIPLASANALEMVGLIETVLSGGGIGPRRGGAATATVVRYLRQIDGGPGEEEFEVEISQSTRQSISLTPDVRTNTIVVRAPRESMPLLEQMIRDLDSSALGSQNIRVFRLANADADAMARILRDLFNMRQQGGSYVLRPREVAEVEAEGVEAAGISSTELTLVPDERQALSVTVDSRTNSLLVSGTSGYLDLVAKVVEELDAAEANERETFVYRLKNATADEVAALVGEFVSEDQRKVVETLGTDELPSAARLLEREVTIVGDGKSNSVVVTASPRYAERVKEIIRELDVDPPQVLIQVLLAEVALSDTEDLGLEFTRFSAGSVNVAGGFGLARAPFAQNNGIVIPGLSGLAPALFSSGIGVPNIAVGSADFDLLINALQTQNRLQVLSNPSVMVANNSEGFIQVGQTVRLPDSVAFSAAGQQSAVTPSEIGVILRVIPTINPEGFVRMEIEPEISRLSRQTVQISEDFQSPIIDRRRANTTVTVRDGQTVVIGGLISDRYEEIEKKIPLLGDIPLIGLLFRSRSQAVEQTELLIVLTPHVITTGTDGPTRQDRAGAVSNRQIDKLNLDEVLIEQIRRGELQGLEGRVNRDGSRQDSIGAPSESREQDEGFVAPAPAVEGEPSSGAPSTPSSSEAGDATPAVPPAAPANSPTPAAPAPTGGSSR